MLPKFLKNIKNEKRWARPMQMKIVYLKNAKKLELRIGDWSWQNSKAMFQKINTKIICICLQVV